MRSAPIWLSCVTALAFVACGKAESGKKDQVASSSGAGVEIPATLELKATLNKPLTSEQKEALIKVFQGRALLDTVELAMELPNGVSESDKDQRQKKIERLNPDQKHILTEIQQKCQMTPAKIQGQNVSDQKVGVDYKDEQVSAIDGERCPVDLKKTNITINRILKKVTSTEAPESLLTTTAESNSLLKIQDKALAQKVNYISHSVKTSDRSIMHHQGKMVRMYAIASGELAFVSQVAADSLFIKTRVEGLSKGDIEGRKTDQEFRVLQEFTYRGIEVQLFRLEKKIGSAETNHYILNGESLTAKEVEEIFNTALK